MNVNAEKIEAAFCEHAFLSELIKDHVFEDIVPDLAPNLGADLIRIWLRACVQGRPNGRGKTLFALMERN